MSEPASPPNVTVEFVPFGRRARVPFGTMVLAAARSVGVELSSSCGGQGSCGQCRAQYLDGRAGVLSEQDRRLLGKREVADGIRLACRAPVQGDVRIDIPYALLTRRPRLALDGDDSPVALDPAVIASDVSLEPPSAADLRPDATRLLDALTPAQPLIGVAALAQLPDRLRDGQWTVRVARNQPAREVVAILEAGSRVLGLAVDVGTTKIGAFLVDLQSGATLAQQGAPNPQLAHGEGIAGRIAYASGGPEPLMALQDLAVATVNQLIGRLCATAGCTREEIVDCVVVGNTAMTQIIAGVPVRALAQAPAVATTAGPLELHASDLGLGIAPGAALYVPPVLCGATGPDHLAMLLACGVARQSSTVLALDIGANTDITLWSGERLWTASLMASPGLEGAQVSNGMRAAPGAIEHLSYEGEALHPETVGGRNPTGLCGSGMLDAIGALRDGGIIDDAGEFVRTHPLAQGEGDEVVCVVVPAARTGHWRPLTLTAQDVHEARRGASLIGAATALLTDAAGIESAAIDEVILAGGFGSSLAPASAMRAGLLPQIAPQHIRQVGNAAAAGARRLLLNVGERAAALALPEQSERVDLGSLASGCDELPLPGAPS